MSKKSALFVCLGNICRSPIAEACFKELLSEKGLSKNWTVDSAATSNYQTGNPPDARGQSCMKSHNTYHHVKKHRARQITTRDFDAFDFILGMDEDNMRDLKSKAPNRPYKAKLLMLGLFDDNKETNGIVKDPYLSRRIEDFEDVYQQCLRSCRNFLGQVVSQQ